MNDKIELIEDWLAPLYKTHHAHQAQQFGAKEPFFLGLTGLQGSGKSTLVETLQAHFSSPATRLARLHNTLVDTGCLHVVAYSLDDLYLTLKDRERQARESGNALWQVRGQFGTHDVSLAQKVLSSLKRQTSQTLIPRFDKAAAEGRGDRCAETAWQCIDTDRHGPVDLVLFEGWGVGMQPLGAEGLERRLESLRVQVEEDGHAQAVKHELSHLLQVDRALETYDDKFMGPLQPLQALLVLEAERREFVYTWRLEQEHHLRKMRDGKGMTDEAVVKFVDLYYPAYELYLPRLLEQGFFAAGKAEESAARQLVITQDIKRVMVCCRTMS